MTAGGSSPETASRFGLPRRSAARGALAAAIGAATLGGFSGRGHAAANPPADTRSTRLIMRYGFKLEGPGALASARERAARLGPSFDSYSGIIFKFYLMDEVTPSLNALILWGAPGYATSYLGSPEFERQVKAFGRPQVQLVLPTVVAQPSAASLEVTLVTGEPAAPGVSWLDPADGFRSLLVYARMPGKVFEVAYLARGGAA